MEAASHALEQTTERWNGILEAAGEHGLREIADRYLSTKHRDGTGAGCVIAALGPDIARHDAPVREAFAQEILQQLGMLASYIPGKTAEQKREQAMAMLAQMVGAIMISRVLVHKQASEEMLVAARKALALSS